MSNESVNGMLIGILLAYAFYFFAEKFNKNE